MTDDENIQTSALTVALAQEEQWGMGWVGLSEGETLGRGWTGRGGLLGGLPGRGMAGAEAPRANTCECEERQGLILAGMERVADMVRSGGLEGSAQASLSWEGRGEALGGSRTSGWPGFHSNVHPLVAVLRIVWRGCLATREGGQEPSIRMCFADGEDRVC